jgi:DNA-binding PadR family transcriptional regulator
MPRDTVTTLPPHWFQILLAVADQDRHGLGIMNDVLERTAGTMKLWPGMLYRNLSKLADAGMLVEVEAPADAGSGGGRPRFYRITASGRRACAAEAERLARFVDAARRKKLLKA